jgi:hypothetical protein
MHGWSGANEKAMFKWSKWPPEFTLSARPEFPQDFPNLRPHLCEDEVSAATHDYNCIAWAASDTTAWWEPDPLEQYYWPEGIAREYKVPLFIAAYQTVGFEVCLDDSIEPGMEKIALFTLNGQPTHAARCLQNGNWTSKLGDYEDIQHVDLACVGGGLYGTPQVYMRRKIT